MNNTEKKPKKIRHYLPVEFYFLLVPAIFLFIFSLLWLKSPEINAFGTGAFLKNSFDLGTNSPIALPVISLLLILFFGILIALFDIISSAFTPSSIKDLKIDKKQTTNLKHLLSIFFIILLITFVAYSLALLTNLLFKVASPVKTGQFGNTALSWDKSIFSTNPGVWMIDRFGGTFFESVLLWVYNSIFIMLYFVLLLSFLFNKKSFRRLILSFFIAWMIALPLWFLFPTLSPDLMFRLNKLNMANAAETKSFNSFNPSPLLKNNLDFQEQVHIINENPAKRLLPTSTFPSMHAVWGVIIAYAGITLSPWLGLFLIPWAILNGFGAVYILEHFSVDIFFGFFIACVAIVITEMLLHFESKYFEDKFGLLSGFDYVKTAFKNVMSIVQKFVD